MCLAVPMKLIEISDDGHEGKVEMAGSSITVNLDLVFPEVKSGDYILIHAGMAIEVLQEEEAQETLDIFREYAQIPGLLAPKT